MMRLCRYGLPCLAATAMLLGACAWGPKLSQEEKLRVVEANLQLAIAYMQEKKFQTAEEKLQKAISTDPRSPQTHMTFGLFYSLTAQPDKADKHYRKAVKLDPGNPDILNNYAQFLCQTDQVAQARKYFLQAVQNPVYEAPEIPYTNLAICLISDDDLEKDGLEEAETYLEKALQKDPELLIALLHMSGLKYRLQEYLSARAYLQRYAEKGAHTPASLWLGVRIERQLGDRDSENHYTQMLRRSFPSAQEAILLDKPRGGARGASRSRDRGEARDEASDESRGEAPDESRGEARGED